MRLTRIRLDAALVRGARLRLSDAAGAHLVRVLRLGVGATISVFDGIGHEHDACIVAVHGTQVLVELLEARASAAESPLRLTLVQAISRAERMDWTVQKATELGVTRIVPLKSEHAVVRLDESSARKKRSHWQSIAESACEQCGRAVLPVIDAPLTLPQYLAARRDAPADGSDLGLVLDPAAGSGLLALGAPPAAISLVIGPEGGLSDAELKLATTHGFRAVRLGPRVLRTETAAVTALCALQVLYGDLAQ